MNEKPIYVTFGNKKLESSFESLKKGKIFRFQISPI